MKEYTNGKYTINDTFVTVGPDTDLNKLPTAYKWLMKEKLVVKPDQLIKRRGKSKLLLLNADWKGAEMDQGADEQTSDRGNGDWDP